MPFVSLDHLQELASAALEAAGASELQASATARALVHADAQGLTSHGTSRVPMYAAHLRHARVDGQAQPVVVADHAAALLVDACDGFAFPAAQLALKLAMERAATSGVALAAVRNSHHFGAAGAHLEPLAAAGMVGIALSNSPAAMPYAGGKRPLFGTNPIAAIFPRRDTDPLLVDLSLSEVARGKIMVAARDNKPIPLGWALDVDGQPTTDAKAALAGSMLPMGGTKGAMLALMVELLVTALTGSRFGAEADSFFVDAGNRPRLGHVFIVIDPRLLAGSVAYNERIEALLAAILLDDDVRLPGARRLALARKAKEQGVDIPQEALAQLQALAGQG